MSNSAQNLHDIAVARIAEMLFTYPNGEFTPGLFHPSWITYTNVPKKQLPVPHHWMGELYPDIVIADKDRANVPMIIAEVETAEDLTLEGCLQSRWKPDKDECGVLYTFVPEGYAAAAARLVVSYKFVFPTAIWTYGVNEKGEVRITPC
ncbi:MAG: hypothetical protein HYX96_01825 [Chloroflexi bacterium]|nr:hypothetical protein [Chloroflexota bacterium]